MEAMISSDQRGYVTAAAVNLVMKAQEEEATLAATLGATLAVPDGQPLVWALKALGHDHPNTERYRKNLEALRSKMSTV
jgi:N-acetylglucosaminyldiphosphoundecaprenol N-acetyl-beta-D-mannosaminyltransferase